MVAKSLMEKCLISLCFTLVHTLNVAEQCYSEPHSDHKYPCLLSAFISVSLSVSGYFVVAIGSFLLLLFVCWFVVVWFVCLLFFNS